MAKTEPRWAGKQGPEAARERDQLVTLKGEICKAFEPLV